MRFTTYRGALTALFVATAWVCGARAESPKKETPRHFKTVLLLKFGEKEYKPGTVFTIEPEKDEAIKGHCKLKFKCARKMGKSPILYRLCVAIIAKEESGGEVMSMTNPYFQIKGKLTSTPTWPAAQKDTVLEFPVKFGDSGAVSPKIHGKGQVYFFVDDGKGTPLSNIVSVEADVAK